MWFIFFWQALKSKCYPIKSQWSNYSVLDENHQAVSGLDENLCTDCCLPDVSNCRSLKLSNTWESVILTQIKVVLSQQFVIVSKCASRVIKLWICYIPVKPNLAVIIFPHSGVNTDCSSSPYIYCFTELSLLSNSVKINENHINIG